MLPWRRGDDSCASPYAIAFLRPRATFRDGKLHRTNLTLSNLDKTSRNCRLPREQRSVCKVRVSHSVSYFLAWTNGHCASPLLSTSRRPITMNKRQLKLPNYTFTETKAFSQSEITNTIFLLIQATIVSCEKWQARCACQAHMTQALR